jgi:hypothetical protein
MASTRPPIWQLGAKSWHLPKSSNIILKEKGIVLFLTCVDRNSGERFVDTMLHGDGFLLDELCHPDYVADSGVCRTALF